MDDRLNRLQSMLSKDIDIFKDDSDEEHPAVA